MQRDRKELGKVVVQSMRLQETLEHMPKLCSASAINVEDANTFEYGLAETMINVGMGHDPYNHVGANIVAECLGIGDHERRM